MFLLLVGRTDLCSPPWFLRENEQASKQQQQKPHRRFWLRIVPLAFGFHFCCYGTEVPLCPLSAAQLRTCLFSCPAWSPHLLISALRGKRGGKKKEWFPSLEVCWGVNEVKLSAVHAQSKCLTRVPLHGITIPSVPCSVKPLGHTAVWWRCGVLLSFILLRIKLTTSSSPHSLTKHLKG